MLTSLRCFPPSQLLTSDLPWASLKLLSPHTSPLKFCRFRAHPTQLSVSFSSGAFLAGPMRTPVSRWSQMPFIVHWKEEACVSNLRVPWLGDEKTYTVTKTNPCAVAMFLTWSEIIATSSWMILFNPQLDFLLQHAMLFGYCPPTSQLVYVTGR